MTDRSHAGGEAAPVVQRLRVRWAKRGRLRFTSHRDFQRALERAVRRAGLPIAYSAGFTPHPRISYVGAAPTGAASEAEYVELALTAAVDPSAAAQALDAALPAGFDVLDVVEARGGTLADRIDASRWEIRLPGADHAAVAAAVRAFLDAVEVPVERVTKDGRRVMDVRAAVARLAVTASAGDHDECVILDVVVRHLTPSVRPDDVVAGLRQVADLALPTPPLATRLAQGHLEENGRLADPLAPDREHIADETRRITAPDGSVSRTVST
ncbi:conserved hypothetical protein [Acidothermus cellulolyticus 11B]|uniref:DUF2344 domain-containing protein n=1 Tax=Acidothermus cellulolyticus (strain ATCC 43068 / DSM 8971 / 11B) TaxID=351607 RepID=A0LSW7_ACIC1|nr:TIGR03936 family radical SAM-associated protein [Acidothermus cellulolyticus]ABK52527.1 conserved hypothetical protein [Acidothermus cellulolyticus 11B]MCL6550536.1 TIGR03936 family radical SAM-associated protein [Acidothermus cellulolyticus]